jgi:hypothetical protein
MTQRSDGDTGGSELDVLLSTEQTFPRPPEKVSTEYAMEG